MPALCTRSDLGARYASGGAGGQTFFGAIVIWNTSPVPCRIAGHPNLSATLNNGRPDPAAGRYDSSVPRTIAVTMPARTPALIDGHLTPGRYLYAALGAPEFTSNGSCSDRHSPLRWIAPNTFTLTIAGLSVTVANYDRWRSENRKLTGCEGQILLEEVHLTS